MQGREQRWRSRPVLSRLVRVLAFLLPLLVALVATVVLSRLVPRPSGVVALAGWLVGLCIVSSAIVMLVERAARRLLPLATLLKLTLLFPDKAPSRYAVARRSGRTQDLSAELERLRSLGEAELALATESVLLLVTTLSDHDRRTRGHSERVRVFTDMLAEELKLPAQDRDRLRWAALLHDIGKLVVQAEILNKAGRPDDEEWAALRRHPSEGFRTVRTLVPWLGPWALTIDHHHERWDGTGYPHGLKGQEISLGGRIVALTDAYDTMTAARPYKQPMSVPAARAELARSAGTHFDPDMVRAFLAIGIGRMRRVTGPLAWLASLPFSGVAQAPVQLAARGLTALAPQAANVAAAVAVSLPIVAGAAAVDATAPARPPPAAPRVIARPTPPLPTVLPSASPAGTDTPAPATAATPSPTPRRGTPVPTAVGTAAPTARPSPPPSAPPTTISPSGRYFLASDGTGDRPSSAVLPLSSGTPASRALPNYDTNRNPDPGLTIKRGGSGVAEQDTTLYQSWQASFQGAVTLSGSAAVDIWSALSGFEDHGQMQVKAYLRDCDSRGTECALIASGVQNRPDWADGSRTWVRRTVDLGAVSHRLEAGRVLDLKLIVQQESNRDLWLAFDTAEYPSALTFS